ncbi:MAG: sugar ABC transporter permease [Chloroflexota bacterium]|nr:sugar ABC transporter permease [Chloroflexota bacterium]
MSTIATKLLGQRTRRWRETITGYLFTSPFLVGFLWFTAIPMAIAFYLAFTKYNIIKPAEWVGLGNFMRLTQDERLRIALFNTAFYAGISVPLYLVTSFLASLAMNLKIKGIRWYRTIFYLPSVTPAVASAMLWVWIFNPQWGMANSALDLFGIRHQDWLLDPHLAKPCLIFMGLWGLGPTMVIFLAGLQGVPESLYEAAMIDGAGTWGRFWNVTVPIISPVIFFNLIMGIIGSFQIFTTAFVMTAAGAGGSRSYGVGGIQDCLLFYVLYLYQQGFYFHHMGYASAMGWLLLTIILILTIIQFRLQERWVYYEAERRL